MIVKPGTFAAAHGWMQHVKAGPPSPDKLIAAYRPESLPGASGQSIAAWPDSSGNGFGLTQTDAAEQPVVAGAAAGGRCAAAFNGNGGCLNIPGGLTVDQRDLTVIMVSKTGLTGWPVMVNLGNGGLMYQQANAETSWPVGLQKLFCSGDFTSGKALPAGSCLHGFTSRAGSLEFHIGNQDYASAGALDSGTLSGGRISGFSGGAQFDFFGAISEILIYHALDAATLSSVRGYLTAKYNLRTSFARQVVFDGNSMTAGYASTAGGNYPNQAMELLPRDVFGYNAGISARTTVQMIADAPAKVDSQFNPAYSKNIVIAWEIRNDIAGGTTAQAAYANYVAYCQARRAAGWKLAAVTVLPSAGGLAETDRAYCNDQIRANWSGFADALADVAADSRIGAAGANEDPTYFADRVHPTNTGYGIVAGIAASALAPLL